MMIGIDFGGTKIEGIVLDDAGTGLARRRIPTPRDDYDGSIAAVRELVGDLEAGRGPGKRRHRHPRRDLAARPASSRTPTPPG